MDDFECPVCGNRALAYPPMLEDDQPVTCAGCGAFVSTYRELKQRIEPASMALPTRIRVSGC